MSGQSPFTPDQAGANALAPSQSVAVTTTSAAFQINQHSSSVRLVTDGIVYARLGGAGVVATTADTKLPAGTHVLGKGGSTYIALVADTSANVNISTGEGGLSSTSSGSAGSGGSSGTTMPSAPFASGTLAGTQLVVSMAGARIPSNVALYSTNVSRAIEVSISGASGPWEDVEYDTNNSTRLGLVIATPVTHIRLTGAIGDAWSVL